MPSHPARLRLGAAKLLCLFILLSSLSMAAGVLFAIEGEWLARTVTGSSASARLHSLDRAFQPWRWFERSRGSGEPFRLRASQRFLLLEVRKERLLASFTIAAPVHGELFNTMQLGDGTLSKRAVEFAIGNVTVNGATLTFLPPELRIDRSGSGVMRFDARPVDLASSARGNGTHGIYIAADFSTSADSVVPTVFVRPAGYRVAGFPVPDEQTPDRVVWRGPRSPVWAELYRADLTPVSPRSGILLPNVLRSGGGEILRFLDPAFGALVLCVPLLIFLLIRWRPPPDDHSLLAFDTTIARLLLLALLLLGTSGAVTGIAEYARRAAGAASRVDPQFFTRRVMQGSAPAGYVVLLLLWPALVARWDRSAPPFREAGAFRVGTPRAFTAPCAVVAAILAAASVLQTPPYGAPVRMLVPAALLAALAIMVAVAGIITELHLLRGGAVLFAASLVLVSATGTAASAGLFAAKVVLMAWLWGRFVLALVKLQAAAATSGYYLDLPLRVRLSIVGGVTVLAVLFVWWVLTRFGLADVPLLSVGALTGDLRPFVTVILATLLIGILYRTSRVPEGRFAPQALAAGPLLGAVFFPPTVGWYYVPVTFLAGWLLLRRLVTGSHVEPAVEAEPQTIRAVLDEVVDVAVFRRALEAHRTGLLGKVMKGEMEFPDYETRREHLESVLADKEKALRSGLWPAPEAVLARGGGADPWRNALLNAGWGAAFGAPWMILYLREAPGYSAASTLLVILQTLLVAAQWPLYGLFFGYFYSRLPGWSGFAKGFWFALSLTMPGVLLNTLSLSPSAAWRDLGFYALQVLIVSLLLGLANDFTMLRRHGFSWRALAELHNLTAVTAWISTLVVAIGTAAAALLTTQATDLFRRALEASGTLPAAVATPPANAARQGQPRPP